MKCVFWIWLCVGMAAIYGEHTVRIGVTANRSTFNISYAQTRGEESLGHTTWVYGLALQHYSKKHLGLTLDLRPAQRRFSMRGLDEELGQYYTYSRTTWGVEMPFLSRFELLEGDFKLIFHAGPQFSYLYKSIESFDPEYAYFEGPLAKYLYQNSPTNPAQLGMVAGAGIALNSLAGTLQLEIRYYQGFTNMYQRERIANTNGQLFGISLSYLYGFKIRSRSDAITP